MSDSDSDTPLGQRATQTPKPGGGAEPAKPVEATAAPKPADESDSDDEPIGAKFAAKLAPGAGHRPIFATPPPPPVPPLTGSRFPSPSTLPTVSLPHLKLA